MNHTSISKNILFFAISAICFSYVITIVIILQIGLPINSSNILLKSSILTLLTGSMIFSLFRKNILNRIQIGLVTFFILYSVRLLYNIFIENEITFLQSSTQILGYYFGLTVLPIFFIVFYAKPIDTVAIHQWSFWALIAGNVALLANTLLGGNIYIDTAFAGRLEITGEVDGTSVLNPIVVGLTGALIIVFCLGRVAVGLVRTLSNMTFHGLLVLVGLANLLAGGSRGPLFGLLLSIALLVVVAVLKSNVYNAGYGRYFVWLFLGGVALVFASLLITDRVPVFLFDRVADTFSGRMGGQLEERDYIFAAAWDIFLASPLIGSHYTVNGGLAHNVVLEMLMSTGVIGAAFFLALAYNAVIGVWRLACGCVGPYGLSIALVTVTYAAIGLTSYSIAQSPELWIFIAISSTLGRFSRGADGQFHERAHLRS